MEVSRKNLYFQLPAPALVAADPGSLWWSFCPVAELSLAASPAFGLFVTASVSLGAGARPRWVSTQSTMAPPPCVSGCAGTMGSERLGLGPTSSGCSLRAPLGDLDAH